VNLAATCVNDNVFEGNLTDIFQAGRGKGDSEQVGWAISSTDYQGFDRDGNGFGDKPLRALYAYADQIWIETSCRPVSSRQRRSWNCWIFLNDWRRSSRS
jgi:nitrous oxidase accessory protein NosD